MKKSTLLAYLVVGGGAYYLYAKHKKEQAAAAAAAAAAQAAAASSQAAPISELPTDSMMPGAMPAAVQGIIKDSQRQAQTQAMTGMGFFGAVKRAKAVKIATPRNKSACTKSKGVWHPKSGKQAAYCEMPTSAPIVSQHPSIPNATVIQCPTGTALQPNGTCAGGGCPPGYQVTLNAGNIECAPCTPGQPCSTAPCPNGKQYNQFGVCDVGPAPFTQIPGTSGPNVQCPAGTTVNINAVGEVSCMPMAMPTPVTMVCPEGFSLNQFGMCTPINPTPIPAPPCPVGMVKLAGQCVPINAGPIDITGPAYTPGQGTGYFGAVKKPLRPVKFPAVHGGKHPVKTGVRPNYRIVRVTG